MIANGRAVDEVEALALPMPKRALGQTGWQASLLTLGGVKWDTQIPEADAVKLIHRAMELGVNTFDTAAGYGAGKSEMRLGLALEGRRSEVFISTKTGKRDGGAAREEMDRSLKRLRTDVIDLMFAHSVEDDADYAKVTAPGGALDAFEEYRRAGHVRFIGVSGHWFKHNMLRTIRERKLDAVLLPVGIFNLAYGYSYFDEVVPAARERGVAVMGMKVFAAGRVKHAKSVEPYLRYSINQPIDTAVIGSDSIAQLEQVVSIVKRRPPGLAAGEAEALFDEARQVTQAWEKGEFNWVSHYVKK